jgi:Cutinase
MQTFAVMYAASLLTNISPQRTDQTAISEGVKAFNKANTACPNAKIIAGGYSQGAAVMHNVISKSLPAEIKNKIVGVALFGDTRNKQDSGHIPNFPNDKSRVWCNDNDGVCGGGLNVNAGHLSYSATSITEAANWLVGKMRSGGSGGSDSSESAPAPAAGLGGMLGKGAKGKGFGGKGFGKGGAPAASDGGMAGMAGMEGMHHGD